MVFHKKIYGIPSNQIDVRAVIEKLGYPPKIMRNELLSLVLDNHPIFKDIPNKHHLKQFITRSMAVLGYKVVNKSEKSCYRNIKYWEEYKENKPAPKIKKTGKMGEFTCNYCGKVFQRYIKSTKANKSGRFFCSNACVQKSGILKESGIIRHDERIKNMILRKHAIPVN